MYLVSVLVRPNITANEDDLKSRGATLGNTLNKRVAKALLTTSLFFTSFIN